MEFCLNRGLVWKFFGWKLIILTAFFCRIEIRWKEPKILSPEKTAVRQVRVKSSEIDLIILRLTYFLILKRRGLALFSLMERY